MIENSDISEQLTGQWEEVLTMYGITIGNFHGLNTKNQPCPLCGGDDRAHWRQTEGRLSLYCRSCAYDKMKSVEDVIMEATGIGFHDLVKELADFVNHVPVEVKQKAKKQVLAKPKVNMPVGDKRDHIKSTDFLASCTNEASFGVLLVEAAQYPYDLPSKNGLPIFPIANDEGILVNLACLSKSCDELNISFIAGGLSYGSWHEIPACTERNTGKVVYCACIIDSIKHWYRTGNAVRCVFDINNFLWMANHNLITNDNVIADLETRKMLFGDDLNEHE